MKSYFLYLKRFKLKNQITRNDLVEIGARVISEFVCEDRYFINKKQGSKITEYTKIRKEADLDEKIISIKSQEVINDLIKVKISSEVVTTDHFLKNYKEVAHLHKKRTTAMLGPVGIHIDKIEGFGDFIELTVMKEKDKIYINKVLEKLKSKVKMPALTKSYLEIALVSQNSATIFFHKVCETLGKFAFGISGGVLTTLGVMVGLLGATSSKLAVIAGIVSVAVADSLSDSISMYSSKKAERGTTQKAAIASAVNVFVGKFVFTLSFILSFLFFSFNLAILINLIWGLSLIILLNLIIAIIQEENKLKTILKNTLVAIFIVVVSYLVGILINSIFGL